MFYHLFWNPGSSVMYIKCYLEISMPFVNGEKPSITFEIAEIFRIKVSQLLDKCEHSHESFERNSSHLMYSVTWFQVLSPLLYFIFGNSLVKAEPWRYRLLICGEHAIQNQFSGLKHSVHVILWTNWKCIYYWLHQGQILPDQLTSLLWWNDYISGQGKSYRCHLFAHL